jgi:hypothetical protein
MALYLTCDDTVVNYHEIDHLKLSYPLRDESSDSDGDSDEVTIYKTSYVRNLRFFIIS